MKRREWLGGMAAMTAAPADGEGARRVKLATQAALAMQRRDWEQGVLAQALLEAGEKTLVIQLTKAAIVQRAPDGRLGVVIHGGPTDPAMGGEAYLAAAEWTGDAEIRAAVEGLTDWIRKRAPRSADGILYHTLKEPEMWSDGLYCAPPFLAKLGHFDEALGQIAGYKKRLYVSEKRLLAHIWDESKGALKRAALWGTGQGWAVAGLARVLRHAPAGREREKAELARFAQDLIDGCLVYQRADGLFHNVVDRPDTFVETNLAQMLAYGIAAGVRAGWLEKRYLEQGRRLQSAARKKMDEFGFVQGACGAPNFDRSGMSTEAQAFCILMEQAAQGPPRF